MGSWSSRPNNVEEYKLSDGEKKEFHNNRVIVYVWKSRFMGGTGRGNGGHVSVEVTRDNKNGTWDEKTYISFWPKLEKNWSEVKKSLVKSMDGNRWSYMADYTGDRLVQNRKPEYIFCFYTLSPDDIMKAFGVFKANENNAWNLHGQYVPRTLPGIPNVEQQLQMETQQSCVSLACLTLDAGKMNELIGVKGVLSASSRATSGVSSDNSAEAYRNFNFIQPSINVSEHVRRQVVSGFIMSPDVLIERMKYAKTNEWNRATDKAKKIRSLGRMSSTTVIREDGSERTITFSSQPVNEPHDLQVRETKGNFVDETTYEWLPGDKD